MNAHLRQQCLEFCDMKRANFTESTQLPPMHQPAFALHQIVSVPASYAHAQVSLSWADCYAPAQANDLRSTHPKAVSEAAPLLVPALASDSVASELVAVQAEVCTLAIAPEAVQQTTCPCQHH